MRLFTILFLSVFFASVSFAQQTIYPNMQEINLNVLDKAKVLNQTEQYKLNHRAYLLIRNKSIDIKLLTIDSLKAMDAKDLSLDKYGANLFEKWDNEVQNPMQRVLVVYDKKANDVTIQGASNWMSKNAQDLKTLKQEYFLPELKKGPVSHGVLMGMDATISYLQDGELPSELYLLVRAFFVVIFIIILFSLVKDGKQGWVYRYSRSAYRSTKGLIKRPF